MLSAYPTKHSRVGNAVGLDTPASAIELLRRMRAQGYDLGPDAFPGVDPTGTEQPDGDALIHALIAAGGQDPEWLTEEQLSGNPIRVPAARYQEWFDALPAELREASRSTGARRRASCTSTTATSCWPSLQAATSSS